MIARPMKLQWFQILLSLSEQDLHGYGIQRLVLNNTGGHMRLWPAMLYRSLNTLEQAGLIKQVPAPLGDSGDERRQYYSLTRDGWARLRDEAEYMQGWVQTVRSAKSP